MVASVAVTKKRSKSHIFETEYKKNVIKKNVQKHWWFPLHSVLFILAHTVLIQAVEFSFTAELFFYSSLAGIVDFCSCSTT